MNKITIRKMWGVIIIFLIATFNLLFLESINAAVKLPTIISSNMVLQRNTTIELWGWADAKEKINIKASWLKKAMNIEADNNGTWRIEVKTNNSKEPQTIKFTSKTSDITLENILFGEVWLCSGQSNMEKPIGDKPDQRPVFNHKEEIANANYPDIRLFHVPRKMTSTIQTDIESEWIPCLPTTIDSIKFSAVGYFFGRKLYQDLNIPIGLIDATWGGTRIEAWTPQEGFKTVKSLDSLYQVVSTTNVKVEKHSPNHLYRGMIAPLTNFNIKGVIWYQGESNLLDVNDGLLYEDKMKALINGWRDKWNNKEMPFYYVQIAPHSYFRTRRDRVKSPNELPLIWEAQTNSMKIPHTGMIVITDLVDDIDDIHPRNKQDVGIRLANVALAKSYGKDIPYSGPMFKSMKIRKGKAILSFTYAQNGLVSREDKTLTYFTIAGEDKHFKPAIAKIKKNKIILYNPEIEKPVAVRFAWDEEARPALFNTEGLPMVPFRTDKWEEAIQVDK